MQVDFAGFAPEGAVLVVLAGPDGAMSGGASAADALSGGQLARAMAAAKFSGKAGSVLELVAPQGMTAPRLLLVGLGDIAKADAAVFQSVGSAVAVKLMTASAHAAVDLTDLADAAIPLADAAAHIAHGASLRAWRWDKYKTKQPEAEKALFRQLTLVGSAPGAAEAHAALTAVEAGVFLTRELVTEPANIIYPESFVARVRAAVEPAGVKVTVLGEAEMTALGMGSLLGVGQGSRRESQLLAMEWNGTGDAEAKPVVFVGKGVCFDTGGISIKPAAGMEDMKWDMGGAGAVAGAMLALAGRKARARVVGVCGLVENMPAGNAQRPGDVVTSMSGQTIEVINTDAEGRLVLADAIWWAQETYKPEVVVDLATLTGAIIVSLGHEYAGLFSNDDGLAAQLTAAGTATAEKLWRQPLSEVGGPYDKLTDSAIADMKNVGPREGGSITAAQFIQRFVQPGVKWAHLDIAGTVWKSKADTLHDKGATGFGVRLLDRFVADTAEGA
ncbi:leucyl aminopeptidase [Sandaracinobacteroides saxicola]|uniref:Probable cytosol aminopeptidase n=1 Tax=Sandaracinobacteroides saxicola TaxID=2759707 RepID=A0A7G5IHB2_9SPHN|nr:leucyl aminopeptidase [Sandaracinobacteroides saxicola]QMW22754.1 leucyl aminopeptidase [Sandaracinobacteroides saxicola]